MAGVLSCTLERMLELGALGLEVVRRVPGLFAMTVRKLVASALNAALEVGVQGWAGLQVAAPMSLQAFWTHESLWEAQMLP